MLLLASKSTVDFSFHLSFSFIQLLILHFLYLVQVVLLPVKFIIVDVFLELGLAVLC